MIFILDALKIAGLIDAPGRHGRKLKGGGTDICRPDHSGLSALTRWR